MAVPDQFQFVDNNRDVRIAGSLVDQGATEGDVLTVNADGSISAAAGGGGIPSGSGSPLNVVTPTGAGALYVDTDAVGLYFATATTSDSWVLIGGNGSASGVSSIPGNVGLVSDKFVAASVGVTDAGAVNINANGTVAVNGDSVSILPNTLGFFAATPTAQPVVPMTVPVVQDVVNALVALGLVSQSD